jgi:hypothetical protein
MGYRGKLDEQVRARHLRGRGWTLQEIADELGVAKSSVSVWTRDVVVPESGAPPARRRVTGDDHPARRRRLAELREICVAASGTIRSLSEREHLVAGLGLYAGDGGKTEKEVRFTNSNTELIVFFCAWLRRFFVIDEPRLRVRIYLHEGLNLERAVAHWSAATEIPEGQFLKPYRAVPRESIRHNKHEHGCAHIVYNCTRTQREILALTDAMVRVIVAPGAGLEPATS